MRAPAKRHHHLGDRPPRPGAGSALARGTFVPGTATRDYSRRARSGDARPRWRFITCRDRSAREGTRNECCQARPVADMRPASGRACMSGPRLLPHYEIRVEGVLGEGWACWFEGLQVSSEAGAETMHLRAGGRPASAARGPGQDTRPGHVPDLGAPAGPRPRRKHNPGRGPPMRQIRITKKRPQPASQPASQLAADAAATRPARPRHRPRPSDQPPRPPAPRRD